MTKTPYHIGSLHPLTLLVPVKAVAPASLSPLAHQIHGWLLDEYEKKPEPVFVRDIVNRFGIQRKQYSPLKTWKEIPGNPLEELFDVGLIQKGGE